MSDRTPAELSTLKRAYLALEEMEARLEQSERAAREPIAIVGIGCRLPGGADGPDAYWRLLADGVDAVTEIPSDRWNVDDYYDPDPEKHGTMATRWGAFLPHIDEFDASLFGISPREAAAVDPQHRLVLEVAWEALEDAGIGPDSLAGSATGVFLGVVNDDYRRLSLARGVDAIDAYYGAGTAPSVASGRLSFVLGLQGPSLTVDTACSTSLVAVHLACRSLRAAESDLALAGGVNVMLLPEVTVALSKLHMMAADGRCKAFDARADGFVRGEGCGIVALKRLSDALAAGDPIHAVIRGSALNQDGPASGLTVPNGPAQEAVIRAALADARVAPGDIAYVEAHGTGTALGDPIELRALGNALGAGRDPAKPLLVGSVKTNLGHLEAAAGIAGLIKAALAVERRQIPPHLHLREPNPHIPWDSLPLVVPTDPRPWPAEAPLLAGVSSFGFSGTNAHVVLEAAPSPTDAPERDDRRPLQVLPLAAADGHALRALAARYAETLATGAELADVAHSAATGRAHLTRRLAVVAESAEAAGEALDAYAGGDAPAAVLEGPELPEGVPRVAFLFTGQGSQYPGMGRALYETSPVFRDTLDRCDEHLRGRLERSLLSVLFDEDGDAIHATGWSQPALVSLELALAELWASWGVRPAAVLGHSVGEYAAVCVAGACSLEDALTLVATRATLMQALPEGGAMAAVRAGEDVVRDAVRDAGGDAVVAAVNGPGNVVVSGSAEGVAAVCAVLAGAGVESRPLTVSHAFHSPRVDPMLDEFERAAADVSFGDAEVRIVSSVTGTPATSSQLADPGYWRRQVREPVRFADAVASLRGLGYDTFVEVGPAPTLLGMARGCLADEPVLWLPSLRPGRDDWRELASSLARLYAHGASIDWAGFDAPYARRRVALPTYPFQRRRHWLDDRPRGASAPRASTAGQHPLLGRRLRSSLPSALWDAELDARTIPFLDDHRVRGQAVLPAAGYVEMALSAAAAAGLESHEIRELVLAEPLVVPDGETRAVQLALTPEGDGATFAISSLAGEAPDGREEWHRHAEGLLSPAASTSPPCELDDLRAALEEIVDGPEHYASLAERGLDFGPSLLGVVRAHRRDGEALARIELPESAAADVDRYRVHPALVDACLQTIASALPGGRQEHALYLPVSIGVVRCPGDPAETAWAHARVHAGGDGSTLRADVVVRDDRGRPVLELLDIVLRPAREHAAGSLESLLYRTAWCEAPLVDSPLEPPSALVDGLLERLRTLADEHDLARHAAFVREADALATAYVVDALRQVEGDAVANRHARLVERMHGMLAEDGLVAPPPADDPAARLARLTASFPDFDAHLAVLSRCGAGLAEALRGERDPLELLFAGGATDEVERLYAGSPEARTFTALAAEAVRSALGSAPRNRALRLLEVGGGTGAATRALLDALRGEHVDYLFTDVSPHFTERARERHGSLRTATFDLERDPADQGFAEGPFDVVVAASVLHATSDLRRTTTRLRELLAPGGLLVLLEGTAPERWVDVTFGLTDGWWAHADDVRDGYPLAPASSWTRLLDEVGFEDATSVADSEERSTQALIIARRPLADSRSWLVLGDRGDVGERLAAAIESAGGRASIVLAGASVDPTDPELDGIVDLRALDAPSADEIPEGPAGGAAALCDGVAQLVRALVEANRVLPGGVKIVTEGAQPVTPAGDVPSRIALEQAPLSGLVRTVELEHAELNVACIDLDPYAHDLESLVRELGASDGETLVAYRRGKRYAARLEAAPAPGPPAPEPAGVRRLVAGPGGLLDELSLVEEEVPRAGAGELVVRCDAAGLNFRDVLNGLAVREDPEPLGSECCGAVVEVGAGIRGFEPGQQVVAIAPGALSSFAVARSELVAPRPRGVTAAEAGGFPIAFLTAAWALDEVAGLEPGEDVLVHAGAGGVGLAAVQLALRAGARVFATAGTPGKRRLLERLGVACAFDSRSLAFADDVRAATGGRGVDVVLNSLAGDAIPASLSVLARSGRFVELGKRDTWSAERVHELRPDVAYTTVDLSGPLLHAEPALAERFAELVARLDAGELRPLPAVAVPMEEAASAFRTMAQGRHVGKLVISDAHRRSSGIRADCTYLVTGGLGGLGLAVCEWLVRHGARFIVLTGRRPPSTAALELVQRLAAEGATIRAVQSDVADSAAVAELLDLIDRELPPLAGVVHAAGVLDDATVTALDRGRFDTVFAPKIAGAWNLHELTRGRDLDLFVLFSSAASVVGARGQGNHAAANAFLDALAHHRVALGLPALALDWGAWASAGAAADPAVAERLRAQGIEALDPGVALRALEHALAAGAVQTAVLRVDWGLFAARGGGGASWLRAVAEGAPAPTAERAARQEGRKLRSRLEGLPESRRRELTEAFVREHAARVLGLAVDEVSDRRPLQELGLDSLMAVELRNALGAGLGLDQPLPASLVFDYPTVAALSEHVLEDILGDGAPRPVAKDSPDDLLAAIEDISDADLDRLLAARLGEAGDA